MTWSPIASLSTLARARPSRLTALLDRFGGGRRPAPFLPKDGTITRAPIEWGVDLDTMTTTLDDDTKFSLKGRCTRCWGNLLARLDDNRSWTGIKCRVCRNMIEGEAAAEEYKKMLSQTGLNLINMHLFGRKPEYGDAVFVYKLFPERDSLLKSELEERVESALSQGKKGNRLTRHDFPPGSPGFLFIQANILMAGVAELSCPDEISVADFPDVRAKDDGTLAVSLSPEGLKSDPAHSSTKLWHRMGTTMIEAMTAAFACELAMKAICLTCRDEAPKTHDLIALHDELPPNSRTRMATDYPEIVQTLRAARHTFGDWRYFEMNSGEAGVQTMIDVSRAHALGKAARVILDEGLMVGLNASVSVESKDNVSVVGDTENHHLHSKVQITAREAPPRSNKHPQPNGLSAVLNIRA